MQKIKNGRSGENDATIKESAIQSPNKSLRRRSQELEMSANVYQLFDL